ncbi:dirigent protein 7-like [Lolium rigidum]|uniref:dirigent protein 7-like n=1 Tax=Lolium rigidum TaxID=89674 RepID=UPI001F5E0CAE|nr:dirigent protein 7-like [Lolium rigidum]
MSPIPSLLLVLLAVAASSAPGVAGLGGGEKLKHIHLYMHETFSGENATEGAMLPSPFGANATFGSVGVFDNELRTGRTRDSPLVARYQGIIVATGVAKGPALEGRMSVASILFIAGEYNGSKLSLEGPMIGFQGTAERSIVGGSGKFRMARGYYLLKLLGLTSPNSAVSEIDFYVLPCDPSYL